VHGGARHIAYGDSQHEGCEVEHLALLRALHVLGVVWWIGGVAMITSIVLPLSRGSEGRVSGRELFDRVELRFARQARVATLLVGITGFAMVHLLHAWGRYVSLSYWWLHAMTLIWALFTLMLFVIEPLLQRRFLRKPETDPAGTMRRMQRVHWVLLLLSVVTIFGAVAGSHGVAF